MKKIIVNSLELSGKALDYAVAKAQGWVDYPDDSIEHGSMWHCDSKRAPFGKIISKVDWKPTESWEQLGPLLEDFAVGVEPITDATWEATEYVTCFKATSTSYKEAACIAIVLAELGDYVEIPESLLE